MQDDNYYSNLKIITLILIKDKTVEAFNTL